MPNATSTPAVAALEVRRTFNASRQRVFDAWASAEALKRWHAPENASVLNATVDFRVGCIYRVEMRGDDGKLHIVTGTYRQIVPPARIVLTWRWETGPDGSESLVTVELIERGSQTELVLTHEGLTSEQSRNGHRHGWVGCLEKLAAMVV